MSLVALQDLFARHREGRSGIWRLGQDPQRTIYLDKGRVVFAQSTHPLDKLTTLLVERGKITQAQLDYAMQNLKPGTSIGRNLIEMGYITQRDLLEVARSQVERVVWGALGNTEETPSFEAKELDASVVRLPMDTPFLFLMGVLHLQDRERLLQMLGPLEQRPDLEGRELPDLPLPADLAKVPALLDGQRSLLDLAREAGAEPMRLGAFALFLREMGLARLKMALVEPVPDVQGLPIQPEPAPPSPLLAAIEAAERPTINLEHLSKALDADSETPEELDLAAELPDPGQTLHAAPLARIHHQQAVGSIQMPELVLDQGSFPDSEAPKSRTSLWLLLILLVATAAWFGYRLSAKSTSPTLSPKPIEIKPLSKDPKTPVGTPDGAKSQPAPVETPAVPEKAKVEVAKDAEPPPVSPSERQKTLAKGDWAKALEQGKACRSALARNHWTLRLEVACQMETVAKAVSLFKDHPADLFILPMAMKDGRICTQVYLGDYASEAEARKAVEGLPAPFQEPGAKPKAFLVASIPDKQ